MTTSDLTLALFTLCNGLRILAYIPQIVRAVRDTSGAEAISFSTWGLFLLANMSAVAYALVNKADLAMAAMFTGNGLGCSAILLIGGWQRMRVARRIGEMRAPRRGTAAWPTAARPSLSIPSRG